MERSKSLELQLTEAELESLTNAVRSTSNGRFAELEFKLRGAWKGSFSILTIVPSFLTLVERYAAEIRAEPIALIAQDGLMPTGLIGDGSTK